MLQLFYSPGSCALASHIALEETGAPYEAVHIDFGADEQLKPAYLAINPKGRVPALATERGILTETPAILVYIAQTFPAAHLAPLADPFALARLQAFNSYLCSTVHVAHAHLRRAYRWSDDAAAIASMVKKAPQNMTACFALIALSAWLNVLVGLATSGQRLATDNEAAAHIAFDILVVIMALTVADLDPQEVDR